jgi:hypothetical protein
LVFVARYRDAVFAARHLARLEEIMREFRVGLRYSDWTPAVAPPATAAP